jgi:hypothetical protein
MTFIELRGNVKKIEPDCEVVKVEVFTKPVGDCKHNLILDWDHTFVDFHRVVDESVSVIYSQLAVDNTNSLSRVPSLVLMRLARGGKTMTLAAIFDKLKKDGRVHPILVSFCGDGPGSFQRRKGETHRESILRLIATQLTDCVVGQSLNMVVDSKALDEHLGSNVVLLIDELNSLGARLNGDAAELLCEMFLDRARRFLVFTCRFPASVESDGTVRACGSVGKQSRLPVSFPGISCVDMSLARTVADCRDLRRMSVACAALTEECAAWLGNIPALIYCTVNDMGMVGCITPCDRFRQMGIIIELGMGYDVLLKRFVRELLSSRRDPLVSKYFGPLAVVDAKSLISYPLCYVKEIFMLLRVNQSVPILLEILDKLEDNLMSNAEGLAWECTVKLGIVLRMLEACWLGPSKLFNLVPTGGKPDPAFCTLPDLCNTMMGAKVRIHGMIAVH